MTLTGWRTLGELRPGECIAAASSLPISDLEDSKIRWDRVVEIQERGLQPTYDLQIEGDHNFLANNLIVHNSHAASFALLVYDSAWLKHYEPAAFTCALLNSQPMGFYAPAQLVQDARRHGVEVRPVSVAHSDWDCTLEPATADAGQPALRLGLRLVRSLTQQGGERVMAARAAQAFSSVSDLAHRAALDRRDLEALAAAGALALLSGNRHMAFWEVAGFERALPLAAADPTAMQVSEGRPLLGMPTEAQGIVADIAAVGLTLGRHPLALLRARLQADGLQCMADVAQLPHGQWVRTAGLVLVRQRPGSASGVTFITLEDETGQLNLIVWKNIGERFRRPLVEAGLLEVQGTLQREGQVLHLVARRLIDRTALTGRLNVPSRDFH
jgi:error-prone DNA polymerase